MAWSWHAWSHQVWVDFCASLLILPCSGQHAWSNSFFNFCFASRVLKIRTLLISGLSLAAMCFDPLWNIWTSEQSYDLWWSPVVTVVALGFEGLRWSPCRLPRTLDLSDRFLIKRFRVHKFTERWCCFFFFFFLEITPPFQFAALLAMRVPSLGSWEDFHHNLKLLSNLGAAPDAVVCIVLTLLLELACVSHHTESF